MGMLPFGALYVWRNFPKDNKRLQGTFTAVVNDVDYTIELRSLPNCSLIFTLDNFITPLGRSEYVEGQRIRASQLEWSYIFAEFIGGYRFPFTPFEQDSAKARKKPPPLYGVPKDTYEGLIHRRIRWVP